MGGPSLLDLGPSEARDVHKLVIIGGGPAAYAAAIYAARANLRPLVIEGLVWGWTGQLMRATMIENYPGFPQPVRGPDLNGTLREQARIYGAEFVSENVTRVEFDDENVRTIWVGQDAYYAQEIIVATGGSAKTLGLDSEQRLTGQGVYYCTTCETQVRHAVVVGGGDTAFSDALALALFVERVTLIHRGEEFAASPIMVDRARANPKIKILTSRVVREILGADLVDGVAVERIGADVSERIDCDGVFVAIGYRPNSDLFAGRLARDRDGYLQTKPGSTHMIGVDGVYAAGDVADRSYRQAITAAASGCQAGMDATRSFASRASHPHLPAARIQSRQVSAPVEVKPGRIVALIPAHNEEKLIGQALASLAAQTRIADDVIVIADNCADGTCSAATALKATVRSTIDNHEKKAGALNQVLAHLLPRLSDNDSVLIMDADTTISPEFLATAEQKLHEPGDRRGRIGGVGGIFRGDPVHGPLERIQDNEYLRYATEIGRRKGRADVLTGTATLFAVQALRDVRDARSQGLVPGGSGVYVYDVNAQTEDNELTLALKHLGYRCVSPQQCLVGTEVMPTLKRLYLQRLRWQRGALENLAAYGVTRHTLPYISKQILTYLGIAFVPFFWTTLVYTWLTVGSMPWSWLWLAAGGIVAVERIWSVRKGGWKAVTIAATLLPEIVYDQFLHGVYVKSVTDIWTHARQRWDHTTTAELATGRARSRWRNRVLSAVFAAAPLSATLVTAVGCAMLGIAWTAIGVFVALGVAQSLLRLSGFDPLGRLLGSGELVKAEVQPLAPARGPTPSPA